MTYKIIYGKCRGINLDVRNTPRMKIIFFITIALGIQMPFERLKVSIKLSDVHKNDFKDLVIRQVYLEIYDTNKDKEPSKLSICNYYIFDEYINILLDMKDEFISISKDLILRFSYEFKYRQNQKLDENICYTGCIDFRINGIYDKLIYFSEDLEDFYKDWSKVLLRHIYNYCASTSPSNEELVSHIKLRKCDNDVEGKYIKIAGLDKDCWLGKFIDILYFMKMKTLNEASLYGYLENLVKSTIPESAVPCSTVVYLICKILYKCTMEQEDLKFIIPTVSYPATLYIIRETETFLANFTSQLF